MVEGIGKRGFSRIVNEVAREYGWRVGLVRYRATRGRRGERSLIAFLRPISTKINLNNFSERMETAIEALSDIQERLALYLSSLGGERGKRFVVIVPVAPEERYKGMGLPFPLRIAIDTGGAHYKPRQKPQSYVEVSGIKLKRHDDLDEALIKVLETVHPKYLSNDVKESYTSFILHSECCPNASLVRNLWFYRYDRTGTMYRSKKFGEVVGEVDAVYHHPEEGKIILGEVKHVGAPEHVRVVFGSSGNKRGKLEIYGSLVDLLERGGYEVKPVFAIVVHPDQEGNVDRMYRELRELVRRSSLRDRSSIVYFVIPHEPHRPKIATYEF